MVTSLIFHICWCSPDILILEIVYSFRAKKNLTPTCVHYITRIRYVLFACVHAKKTTFIPSIEHKLRSMVVRAAVGCTMLLNANNELKYGQSIANWTLKGQIQRCFE